MLDGFGFCWIEASGEAEVELAEMSKLGMIDAIMMEDSDTIIFGVTTILRLDLTFAMTGQVRKYEVSNIMNLGFDKAGLVIIALLVGGDYLIGLSTAGCGIETALKLAHAGLGIWLIEAIEHQTNLDTWGDNICDELHKSSLKCQQDFANSIPADFPDINIVNLYLNPAVHQHDIHQPAVSGNSSSISLLAIFAEENFVWGDMAGILEHFTNDILPGLVM
ncbi:hypothetical protein BDZ94DRAFT_1327184 [Collybia nuda]|uniref:XPG-I domain-containing protein n=1 Tax=Collybia nuda TaxID=64659 RepID=A0A9P5XUV9_9AGAR|nr:hypothetical protein BDZ94DRAFT_1327184 [Collybia nuda]